MKFVSSARFERVDRERAGRNVAAPQPLVARQHIRRARIFRALHGFRQMRAIAQPQIEP